jgi:hypothetical protein
MSMRFRRGAVFVADPAAFSTKLNRKQRTALMWHAKAKERCSKRRGCPNGALGYAGLRILEALLFGSKTWRRAVLPVLLGFAG